MTLSIRTIDLPISVFLLRSGAIAPASAPVDHKTSHFEPGTPNAELFAPTLAKLSKGIGLFTPILPFRTRAIALFTSMLPFRTRTIALFTPTVQF